MSTVASCRVVHEAVATIVRPASVTAFAAEILAVAVTSGEIGWASWRRLGLGWRFWMGLGERSATLAFGCLIACLVLAASRRSCGEQKLKDTRWCVWLNIATIVSLFFVPAIAAL